MKPTGVKRDYARKVQEGSRCYAEHQAELVAKLEVVVASLDQERAQLEAEVKSLRAVIQSRESDRSRLSAQVAEIVEENKRLSAEYVQVEHQSSSLANLYAASFRLHDSLDRAEVLTAIQEIVISIIGCEEQAILALDETAGTLGRIASFGLAEDRLQSVPLGSGVIGRTAATGEAYIRDDNPDEAVTDPGEAGLTACIPLKVGDKVTGVIALFTLLSHKPGIEDVDRELFELLGTQAATTL
jgi:hypothetical protein